MSTETTEPTTIRTTASTQITVFWAREEIARLKAERDGGDDA